MMYMYYIKRKHKHHLVAFDHLFFARADIAAASLFLLLLLLLLDHLTHLSIILNSSIRNHEMQHQNPKPLTNRKTQTMQGESHDGWPMT